MSRDPLDAQPDPDETLAEVGDRLVRLGEEHGVLPEGARVIVMVLDPARERGGMALAGYDTPEQASLDMVRQVASYMAASGTPVIITPAPVPGVN